MKLGCSCVSSIVYEPKHLPTPESIWHNPFRDTEIKRSIVIYISTNALIEKEPRVSQANPPPPIVTALSQCLAAPLS